MLNKICKYWPLVLMGLLPMIFSGCASMMAGKGDNQITINSTPSGAKVYDDKDNLLGETPLKIEAKSFSTSIFRVKKEGYVTEELSIPLTKKKGPMFLDAMLLCIPCIFDIKNNSFSVSETRDNSIQLKKKVDKASYKFFVKLLDPVNGINDNESLGKRDHSNLKYTSKNSYLIGYDSDHKFALCNSFSNLGLSAYNCSSDENRKGYVYKQAVPLKVILRSVAFDLKTEKKFFVKGTANATFEYKFYSPKDDSDPSAVFKITCSASGKFMNTRAAIDSLFSESVRTMLLTDTIVSYLNANYNSQKQETLAATTIKVSPPAKFKNTKEMIKASTNGVVTVVLNDGFGSGAIISNDGYIITNYHVLEDTKTVKVKLNSGIELDADVVKTNEEEDLALLKVKAGTNFSFIPFGNSDSLELGDVVYAIGTPTDVQLSQSVTKGIVSGKRKIEDKTYIQTDVSINPGNSGGPLINEQGEIAGIITMKLVGKGVEGLGFVIPINTVVEKLNIKTE